MSEAVRHKVFLGMPVGGDGGLAVATHRAVAALTSSACDVSCEHAGGSALTFNFNALWADVLNRRAQGEAFDVFAMIHTDIAPQSPTWLAELLAIFDRERADVLSVIVPIKDEKGLTSTALDTNRWTPRRLTMQEVHALPPTFDDAAVRAKYGAPLLLNTGLMLVRLTEPWAADVCFSIDNCIHRDPGGQFVPLFEPEDWRFSRWANQRGLRLVATREVVVGHLGHTLFTNDRPWGVMPVDTINLNNTALGQLGALPTE